MTSKRSTVKDKVAEFRDAFQILKSNKKDRLTPQDLTNGLRHMGHEPSDSDVEEILEEFDNFELEQAFRVFDKDGDGFITTVELGTVMRSLGISPTHSELEGLIDELDEDGTELKVGITGNGMVDFPEFMAIAAKTKKESDFDVRIREAFKVFDKDNTGSIDVTDFRNLMTNLGDKVTDEDVDEIIQEVGLTPDRKITCEDFIRVVTF